MVPEEWPIAPPTPQGAASPARHAGRARLPVVARDFFLDPAKRLTEQERALMTAMLADLIGTIADELRASLPTEWSAANDEDGHQLLLQLSRAALLNDEELIALLLRRADEERIAAAVRLRAPGRAAFLQALVSDPDGDVSAAAMAVILARGGRRDRLGQPRMQLDDLPDGVARRLTYAICGAIRSRFGRAEGARAVDEHLATASEALLQRGDDKNIGAQTVRLAAALRAAGRLGDEVLHAAAEEGDLAFLAAALAQRANVPEQHAWDHLIDGGSGRLMLLLRMAATSRNFAAAMLGLLGDLLGLDDGGEIGRFDALDEAQVDQRRAELRLHPLYHEALLALGING